MSSISECHQNGDGLKKVQHHEYKSIYLKTNSEMWLMFRGFLGCSGLFQPMTEAQSIFIFKAMYLSLLQTRDGQQLVLTTKIFSGVFVQDYTW